MRKFPCLLGLHKYKVIRAEQYIDVSYGGKVHKTQILKRCKKCDKAKSDNIRGLWNLEDFSQKGGHKWK